MGNIMLHMEGNMRQWVLGGVGNREVERNRASEFAADGGSDSQELLSRLDEVAREADRVLADVPESTLLERIDVQGFEVSRLQAAYHAIEHFGYHLAQVVYITKLRTGKDLAIFP